ncbi:MAG: hypothetical protein QOE87_3604 [Gaiellales bacterium]|nr:hypothetical protein [Gaiellales bacterium]
MRRLEMRPPRYSAEAALGEVVRRTCDLGARVVRLLRAARPTRLRAAAMLMLRALLHDEQVVLPTAAWRSGHSAAGVALIPLARL